MFSQVVIMALAATAAAEMPIPGHFHIKRDALQARQLPTMTFGGDASCITDAVGLVSDLPTPPPKLVDWDVSAARTMTDPCDVTPPASLSDAYNSYTSTLLGWLSDHEDDISSLIQNCPPVSSYINSIPVCATSILTGLTMDSSMTSATASNTNTNTNTATDNDATTMTGTATTSAATGSQTSAGSSASPTTGAAAPRQTGVMAAAGAVAGIIGAVAAL